MIRDPRRPLQGAGLTRRDLLARVVTIGTAFAIGGNFIAAPDAAWALETSNVKPETMATLARMARDIYPHDRIPDQYYVVAVKGYDTAEDAAEIEAGIAALNAAAQGIDHPSYDAISWEADRTALLVGMQDTPFFQRIRGGLVTGLYNQKEVWPYFGYEGESFSKGGYISRGFDDIAWL